MVPTIIKGLNDDRAPFIVVNEWAYWQNADQPWWDRIAGRFENDMAFEEIIRLGREYREAQVPEND